MARPIGTNSVNAPLGATRFDRWLASVFDRPVVEPGWWFDSDSDAPEVLGATDAVAFMAQLCEHADHRLAPYSDAQVSQGLWYIIGSGASEWALAAVDGGVSPKIWVRCIRAFSLLFERLFAPRCSPHLGHLSELGASSLNTVCYMWWDIMYLPGWQDEAERTLIHAACLQVMRETLYLPSDACRESVLHGLGHWRAQYPEPVAEIIDRFLADIPKLRPELVRYARNARGGCVL